MRRSGRFPVQTPSVLNGFIIHVSLPALVLLHIHTLTLDKNLLLAALMPWLVFFFAILYLYSLGRAYGWSQKRFAALLLTAGLGNTSFVGIPMLRAFYGEKAIGLAIVADQLGTFLVLSTLGIFFAVRASSGRSNPKDITKRILSFPPFQALFIAFLLIPIEYPEWLSAILGNIGNTLTPIALVSVGFQLKLGELRSAAFPLTTALAYKLLLAPALIYFLFRFAFSINGLSLDVIVLESAMAPMITGGIIAMSYGLEEDLSSLMLGVGIPVSLLTVSGIYMLIS